MSPSPQRGPTAGAFLVAAIPSSLSPYPAGVAIVRSMRRRPSDPPIHPFAVPLLALCGAAIFGLAYWLFGVGRDAFYYLFAALIVFGLPGVIVFGIGGLVWVFGTSLGGQNERLLSPARAIGLRPKYRKKAPASSRRWGQVWIFAHFRAAAPTVGTACSSN